MYCSKRCAGTARIARWRQRHAVQVLIGLVLLFALAGCGILPGSPGSPAATSSAPVIDGQCDIDQGAAAGEYRIGLTNNGTTAAQVTGYVVAFYDSTGSEVGSDDVTSGVDYWLTAGQNLLLRGEAPAFAVTCDLVQWYDGYAKPAM
jgi:hypothetical protein